MVSEVHDLKWDRMDTLHVGVFGLLRLQLLDGRALRHIIVLGGDRLGNLALARTRSFAAGSFGLGRSALAWSLRSRGRSGSVSGRRDGAAGVALLLAELLQVLS